MQELHSLGFKDRAQCEGALRQSGGDVHGALSVLQRPLLEPFHQRVWCSQPEAPIDVNNPDKQVGADFTKLHRACAFLQITSAAIFFVSFNSFWICVCNGVIL